MIIARFLLAINLALLGACASAPTVDAATRHPPIKVSPSTESVTRHLSIEGSPMFVKHIQRALDLLKTKSPQSYQMVNAYIGKIRQAARSGMLAYVNPPTFDLNNTTAYYSVTWCAGAIVHEAYHSMLYHSHVEDFGRPVPDQVWGGVSIELEAIKYQVQVMKELGAPLSETFYLSRLDGTHNDVNGDGVYDWKDYRLGHW